MMIAYAISIICLSIATLIQCLAYCRDLKKLHELIESIGKQYDNQKQISVRSTRTHNTHNIFKPGHKGAITRWRSGGASGGDNN